MRVLDGKYFLKDVTSVVESDIMYNPSQGNSLTVEVTGTASSFSLKVQGIVNLENKTQWSDLGWVDSTLGNNGIDITSFGSVAIGVGAYSKLHVSITNISGGTLSVYGRLGVE